MNLFRAFEKTAEVLKSGHDGREKSVIFITDEKITSSGNEAAAEALRALGATVFAVGVGDVQESQELINIAGAKDRVFIKDFNHLNREFGDELSSKVCQSKGARVKRFWSTLFGGD